MRYIIRPCPKNFELSKHLMISFATVRYITPSSKVISRQKSLKLLMTDSLLYSLQVCFFVYCFSSNSCFVMSSSTALAHWQRHIANSACAFRLTRCFAAKECTHLHWFDSVYPPGFYPTNERPQRVHFSLRHVWKFSSVMSGRVACLPTIVKVGWHPRGCYAMSLARIFRRWDEWYALQERCKTNNQRRKNSLCALERTSAAMMFER